MLTVRKVIPALCLATSLSALAVYAAPAAPAPTAFPAAAGHGWHHGRHGFMGMVLHELNLTDAQRAQVKSIMAGNKSQFEALRASVRANREALATTAPTDPGYPALIETAQTNAATRIKLESETWSSVYSGVLTKTQQEAIPGIVAAAKAQREQRMAAWQARHSQVPTSTEN